MAKKPWTAEQAKVNAKHVRNTAGLGVYVKSWDELVTVITERACAGRNSVEVNTICGLKRFDKWLAKLEKEYGYETTVTESLYEGSQILTSIISWD